jgi:hypothetical protein
VSGGCEYDTKNLKKKTLFNLHHISQEFDAIKLAAPKAYKPYVAVKRDRHDWACPPPTMILTRGGA